MDIKEYAALDGMALGQLVKAKKVSPFELLEATISATSEVNPKINAIVYKDFERALERAQKHEVGDGNFEGVPLLLKDIFGFAEGFPTRSGSKFVPQFSYPFNQAMVSRLEKQGMIPFAKSNVPEFGFGCITEPTLYGPCRNPWSTDLTPGGSSGGAAAAVAAGIVPFAHANDAAGSIRIPASCCGLVGLKPTRGRVSFAPVGGEMAGGLTIENVVSRTVRDSAAALDAINGSVLGDPYIIAKPDRPYLEEIALRPRRLKIGFSDKFANGESVHADCVQAVRQAAKLCESLGHEVVEASPTFDHESLSKNVFVLFLSALRAGIERVETVFKIKVDSEQVESLTWKAFEISGSIKGSDIFLAQTLLSVESRKIAPFFQEYDLWLTPTLGLPPLPVGSVDHTSKDAPLQNHTVGQFVLYCSVYNVTGQPAISLPLYWNEANVPIGVSFGTKYGDEAKLFQLAAQLEEAQPWNHRKPQVHAGEFRQTARS
jgi:amidase